MSEQKESKNGVSWEITTVFDNEAQENILLQKVLHVSYRPNKDEIENIFVDNCMRFHSVYFYYVYKMLHSIETHVSSFPMYTYLTKLLKTYSIQYFVKDNNFSSVSKFELLMESIKTGECCIDYIKYIYEHILTSEQETFMKAIVMCMDKLDSTKVYEIFYNLLEWSSFRVHIIGEDEEGSLHKSFLYKLLNAKRCETDSDKLHLNKILDLLLVEHKDYVYDFVASVLQANKVRNTERYVVGLSLNTEVSSNLSIVNLFMSIAPLAKVHSDIPLDILLNTKVDDCHNDDETMYFNACMLFFNCIVPIMKRTEHFKKRERETSSSIEYIFKRIKNYNYPLTVSVQSELSYMLKQQMNYIVSYQKHSALFKDDAIHIFVAFCKDFLGWVDAQNLETWSGHFYIQYVNKAFLFLENYCSTRYSSQEIGMFSSIIYKILKNKSLHMSYKTQGIAFIQGVLPMSFDKDDAVYDLLNEEYKHLFMTNRETTELNSDYEKQGIAILKIWNKIPLCAESTCDVVFTALTFCQTMYDQWTYYSNLYIDTRLNSISNMIHVVTYKKNINRYEDRIMYILDWLQLVLRKDDGIIQHIEAKYILSKCVSILVKIYENISNLEYILNDIFRVLLPRPVFVKELHSEFPNHVWGDLFPKTLYKDMAVIEDEIHYEDIPEHFLDPLLMTPIEEPVLLPDTDIIMDANSILRHLLKKEENPFTRGHLTEDMLDEFQHLSSTVEKISEFKHRYNEWKRQYNKK